MFLCINHLFLSRSACLQNHYLGYKCRLDCFYRDTNAWSGHVQNEIVANLQ